MGANKMPAEIALIKLASHHINRINDMQAEHYMWCVRVSQQ